MKRDIIQDFESRPYLQEVIEHPLFQLIPKTPTYIQHGLQSLLKWMRKEGNQDLKKGNSTAVNDKTSQEYKHIEDELIRHIFKTSTKKTRTTML